MAAAWAPFLQRGRMSFFDNLTNAYADAVLRKVDDILAGDAKNGLALALDVDKQEQIDAAVKAAEARFGRIDVLVNNAGLMPSSPLERLKIDDPLLPTWRDLLANLAEFPSDEHGFRIGRDLAMDRSHRHYSHLLMIYPLYIMNLDQPENRELVIKSLNHWMGMPKALRGYSYTGAASISALLGQGEDAAKYLNRRGAGR